jgi:pSer/pThr/pTyr-binding forkhead associated (FHA) protein
MHEGAVLAETASELKARLEAERGGREFLVYRDAAGQQIIRMLGDGSQRIAIGRAKDADVTLEFDDEVSRVHAELERVGGEWAIVDDGLSRNGSFVNGERVVGRRRLRDGDAVRLGGTVLLFRAPGRAEPETAPSSERLDATSITDTQRRVLVALCRPFGAGSELAAPASNKEIAEQVFLSVDAVKAHLRALFGRFDVGDLPQNKKRVRLAELAFRSGVISARDLEG